MPEVPTIPIAQYILILVSSFYVAHALYRHAFLTYLSIPPSAVETKFIEFVPQVTIVIVISVLAGFIYSWVTVEHRRQLIAATMDCAYSGLLVVLAVWAQRRFARLSIGRVSFLALAVVIVVAIYEVSLFSNDDSRYNTLKTFTDVQSLHGKNQIAYIDLRELVVGLESRLHDPGASEELHRARALLARIEARDHLHDDLVASVAYIDRIGIFLSQMSFLLPYLWTVLFASYIFGRIHGMLRLKTAPVVLEPEGGHHLIYSGTNVTVLAPDPDNENRIYLFQRQRMTVGASRNVPGLNIRAVVNRVYHTILLRKR